MNIKTIRLLIFILLVMSFVFVCYATVTNIGSFGFSISPSQTQSSSQPWTAQAGAVKNEVYIHTQASVTNSGAEDTYYQVALKTYGAGCSKVLANGSQVRRNMYSYKFTNGSSYAGFAWRFDDTLRTNIVNGYVFILKGEIGS